ncbi:MAG: glycosidase, partial [Actinobacteria bacterium]|nr:glycosidase [Actinomycetota bacterium]
VLLDLDDPTVVTGHLTEPLLSPDADEREGYVPNVVYSCGAIIHGEHLVLPYSFADLGTRLATIPVAELLGRLTG